jgi:hypothetical protein
MFASVADWFLRDPLQNFLLVFGGSGLVAGAFKWGAVWADRRRIAVRVLSEHYDPKSEPNLLITLRFEVTNIGEKVTSLGRVVVVRALTPKLAARHVELQVQESDLQLPSHSQRQFTALATTGADYVFCRYKRYLFKALRGSGAIVRYRNAENIDISFLDYWLGYAKLRFFKRV